MPCNYELAQSLLPNEIIHVFSTFHIMGEGAQRLSGRVLGLRPRGPVFEPHRRHCVVSLSKTH